MALGQEKGRVTLFATLSGANDSTMPAGGKETGPFDPVVDHILLKRAMVRIDPWPVCRLCDVSYQSVSTKRLPP
jgi:hypothetical protein